MGFFDSIGDILKVAAPIAVTALSGGTLGSSVAAIQTASAITEGRSRIIGEQQKQIAAQAAAAGMNGSLRRRTIVETFNPATGAVVKQEVMKGAPAVMQSDVAAANRLNRQLKRLNAKQPRKIVHQSEAARLKDELLNASLRAARDAAGNGHNGNDQVIVRTT